MITFNGIPSDSLGVIVERMPNRYTPSRRISAYEVAGRNGNVLHVDDAFPNVTQEYEVYFTGEQIGLPLVARACAEWLCSVKGYAELTDTYDPTVIRYAYLESGYDIENVMNQYGRAEIAFSCMPQKYLLSGQEETSDLTVINPTPFDAKPLITVSGQGTITIGSRTITVLETVANFEIDCETQNADDNTKISCLEFPVLTSGENTITLDGITSFKMIPRWWTL